MNIKLLLSNESKYQNMCAPSLQNALVHAKVLEVNDGMYIFSIITLVRILTHAFLRS